MVNKFCSTRSSFRMFASGWALTIMCDSRQNSSMTRAPSSPSSASAPSFSVVLMAKTVRRNQLVSDGCWEWRRRGEERRRGGGEAPRTKHEAEMTGFAPVLLPPGSLLPLLWGCSEVRPTEQRHIRRDLHNKSSVGGKERQCYLQKTVHTDTLINNRDYITMIINFICIAHFLHRGIFNMYRYKLLYRHIQEQHRDNI